MHRETSDFSIGRPVSENNYCFTLIYFLGILVGLFMYIFCLLQPPNTFYVSGVTWSISIWKLVVQLGFLLDQNFILLFLGIQEHQISCLWHDFSVVPSEACFELSLQFITHVLLKLVDNFEEEKLHKLWIFLSCINFSYFLNLFLYSFI